MASSSHSESNVRFVPAAAPGVTYLFGPFRLDPAERVLTKSGLQVPLSPKSFDTLLLLVRSAPHLVAKSGLMSTVWPDSFVEEANLTVAISSLRKALGDDNPQERHFIQTASKIGYRFVAEVERVAPGSDALSAAAADAEPARIAPTHGVRMSSDEEPRSSRRRLAWYAAAIIAVALALAAFTWQRSLGQSSPIRSVAVLPFRMTGTAGQSAYLGVGVSTALINQLSGDTELMVPSAGAVSSAVKGPVRDPVSAGHELGVNAVLDGEIHFSQAGIAVDATLTRVSDGKKTWSLTFTEPADPNLSLADVLEERIATRISSSLADLVAIRGARRSDSRSDKARTSYLRGRYYWNRRTEDTLRKSIASFQEAIAEDPNYALAYAGLADSYALLASFSIETGRQASSGARSAALSAIHLDPSLAEPHASLGMIAFFTDWDYKTAEEEFQKAIALEPNYATAHHWYALDLAAMNRPDQALYEIHKAEQLEPLSPIISTNVGWILYLNRRYPDAEQALQRVLEIDPTFVRARTRLGITYTTERRYKLAVQELSQALKLSGGDPYIKGLLGAAQAHSRERAGAERLVAQLVKESRQHYVPPFSIALIYIGLGRRTDALKWLQKAYEDHSTSMVYARVDPELDLIRSNSDFQSILAQMKF